MPTLPAGEMALLRAAQDDTLPGTAVISRQTLVDDGAGGFTETTAEAYNGPARLSPVREGGAEAQIANQYVNTTGWVVTLPYDTVVLRDDTIQMDGHTLNVVAVLSRSLTTALRVVATEAS